MIENKYYISEWTGLSKEDAIKRATEYENDCAENLIKKAGFIEIIHTGKTHKTIAEKEGLILPDLMGIHSNGKNYFIECKRKNRRIKFNDNGIDLFLIESYLKVQETFNIEVIVLFKNNIEELNKIGVKSWFVDELGNAVWYGNFLNKLCDETPDNPITITENNGIKIKCFPLGNMQPLQKIFQSWQTKLNFDLVK